MPHRQTASPRRYANPRRTTLVHAGPDLRIEPGALPEIHREVLPDATANPRRTVLDTLPEWRPAAG
ncbi:hypothetical protein BIV57_10020 [Mangrovactinospora gilvigrisea]|uniref:Uncharacterized protein n=1 Tax=Mangrovactinospora gilvigrisea TaxID=1428644 RepID=A0A1J7C7X0_9ACTN|nr:hypothetical protein [Mangrovactinospora gilvigrisea]OIV37632.1 hypothetical protein BIV57_10020 [Mangrovactinospora gilvigrisea]